MTKDGKRVYETLKAQEETLTHILSGTMEAYTDDHIALMGEVKERVSAALAAIDEGKDSEAFLAFSLNTHLCMTATGVRAFDQIGVANKRLFRRAVDEGH